MNSAGNPSLKLTQTVREVLHTARMCELMDERRKTGGYISVNAICGFCRSSQMRAIYCCYGRFARAARALPCVFLFVRANMLLIPIYVAVFLLAAAATTAAEYTHRATQ